MAFDWFKQSTFKGKIFLGFSGILAVIIVIVAVGVGTGFRISDNFRLFSSSSEDALAASALQRNMAGMQRSVGSYLHSHDKRHLNAVKQYQSRVEYHAKSLRDTAQEGLIVDVAADVMNLLSQYIASFDKVVELMIRRDDLAYNRLRMIGDQINENLSSIFIEASVVGEKKTLIAASYVNVVQQKVHAVRLHVREFLDTEDQESVALTKRALDDALQKLWTLMAVEDLAERREAIQEALDRLPQYEKTFDELVAVVGEQHQIVSDVLEVIGRKVQEKAESVTDHAILQEDKHRKAAAATMTSSTNLAIAIGIIGLLVALAMASSLAYGLIRNLSAITDSMIRLSKGDIRAEVPATERPDEIGELARAYQVFKENNLALSESEHSLRESQAYNRMLFETSPIGLAVVTPEGRIADVNPAFAVILGYSVKEAGGLNFWDISPVDFSKEDRRQLDMLKSVGKLGPYEKIYLHKDGRQVPARISGIAIQKDGENFILASVEDITERHKLERELARHQDRLQGLVEERSAELRMEVAERSRTELALAESRQRPRDILDTSPFGVSIIPVDSEKRIFVNQGYLNLFGAKSEHEMLSQDFAESFADPKDWKRLQKMLRSKRSGQDIEMTRKRLDGTSWTCRMEWQGIRFEGEVAVIFWVLDVSGGKKGENDKTYKAS